MATAADEAYPRRWEADVVLSDGAPVHLRPIRPDDAERLAAFHERQSSESIYFRFFSPRPRLSERELAHFTTVDYLDHMAFVAVLGDEMVAMAGYDRYSGTTHAEVAVIVDDGHHHRGLATVMLEYLAVAARENGLDRFVAQVLPNNRKMLTLLKRVGFDTTSTFADGIIEVTLDLEPTPEARSVIAERARRSGVRSVARLLEPRSVAVIGASRRPESVGHCLVRNLLDGGFAGPVYPVNRNASSVASVRAWPDVGSIPDQVDLAVVAVPAHTVGEVVDACATKRVRALVVVTAGFGQFAPYDVVAQQALVERVRGSGMRLLGPAALGIVNTRPGVSLNLIASGPVQVHPGRAALLSQSGSMGLAILEHAERVGVGVSTFVGVGDRADVSANDLLRYWEVDERTDVVLAYQDTMGNPANFNRIARRLGRAKPLVVVRSAMAAPVEAAGDDVSAWPAEATVGELLAQAGAIRTDTIPELLDVGRLLLHQPLPTGRRLAVITNSGGPARLAADACLDAGLDLAHLSSLTRGVLASARPADGRVGNPLDLGFRAGPDDYAAAVAAVAGDEGVDAVLCIYAPPVRARDDEVARAIAAASASASVPVVASLLGREHGQLDAGTGRALCFFAFPEQAVRALGRVASYAEWRGRPEGVRPSYVDVDPDEARRLVAGALAAGHHHLDPDTVARVVATFGVDVAPAERVDGPDAAVAAAERLGWPVVLKATGLARLSRGEAGGVALELHDADAVRAAHARLADRFGDAMRPVEVQRQVPAGAEARVALHQHPSYGAVLTVGLGGSLGAAEATPPVRVLPLTDLDAHELVERSALPAVLAAVDPTGSAGAALEELLCRLAQLAEAAPELADLVLDPVLVSATGAAVTAVRARVAPWASDGRPAVRRLAT